MATLKLDHAALKLDNAALKLELSNFDNALDNNFTLFKSASRTFAFEIEMKAKTLTAFSDSAIEFQHKRDWVNFI